MADKPINSDRPASRPISDDALDSISGGSVIRSAIPASQEENEQMLQVQMAMQRENQVYTSVSNVLKTRDDTAKNSIGN